MNNIGLTDKQATTLRMYLLITTKYREREIAACRELGGEINKDGSLKYPNMKDNAEWWEKANIIIDDIIKLL